jgi:tRNA dimethylallyltransferase
VKPLFLLGPTASGKHEASILIARELGFEIVSVDSMKVYRMMDLGTAKPSKAMLDAVPHHLVDICDPSETYSAGRFCVDARAAQEAIEKRGRRAFFVGGTSLYYKACVYGMFEGPSADPSLRAELKALGPAKLHEELKRVDPAAAAKLHPNDEKRLTRAVEVHRLTGRRISDVQTHWKSEKPDVVTVCLTRKRDDLERRVAARVKRMIADGLVDEVRRLLAHPAGWSQEGRNAIGYRETIAHLEGRLPIAAAEQEIVRNTMKFLRRQLQWFRSFKEATMLEVDERDGADRIVSRILALVTP